MNKKEIFEVLYGKENWEVYRRFQAIEDSIDNSNILYKYFDEIKNMLIEEKSYLRVRGFRLICKLSKYDKDNKINNSIDVLLKVFDDDKPTSIRQYLHSLDILLHYKPELTKIFKDKFNKIDYSKYKDSMRPLIKKDIDNLLKKN